MEYDPTIWRDAYKMGVDPLDVYRVYPSVIKDFVKKIKEKLKDIWDSGTGTLPVAGTLLVALAAPIYAACALTM